MAQEYQQSGDGSIPLRSQRMTADESRAVIALWQQEQVEQTGLTDKAAVPDVAEGLDITVEDVQRLLQEVRTKRIEEQHALASEQELTEVRLAEEERKLAEVRRQRAELERQRAEQFRKQAEYEQEKLLPFRVSTRRASNAAANPIGTIIGIIVFILWVCFIVSMASRHGGSPFSSPPAEQCSITAPDGTQHPCSPDEQAAIDEAIANNGKK